VDIESILELERRSLGQLGLGWRQLDLIQPGWNPAVQPAW